MHTHPQFAITNETLNKFRKTEIFYSAYLIFCLPGNYRIAAADFDREFQPPTQDFL